MKKRHVIAHSADGVTTATVNYQLFDNVIQAMEIMGGEKTLEMINHMVKENAQLTVIRKVRELSGETKVLGVKHRN